MPAYKVPLVHSAIVGHPIFQMPFNPNSYTDIFSRFGAALEIGRIYIDKVTVDSQHADVCQAVIDEVVQTLSAHFAAINLPWVADQNEVPFWRALVESGRLQLEMYAEYAAKPKDVMVYEAMPGTPPPFVDEPPFTVGGTPPTGNCC